MKVQTLTRTVSKMARTMEMSLRHFQSKIDGGVEIEKGYKALIAKCPAPIIIHRNGSIVYANEDALRSLGVESNKDILGKSMQKFFKVTDVNIFKVCGNGQKKEGGLERVFEIQLLLEDSSPSFYEVTAIPISFENEPACLWICTDITHRKMAEIKDRMTISELEAKNSELESFTYTVSHDLKAPLVTIKVYLSLLEKDLSKQETNKIKEEISSIRIATDQMQKLLEDLLNLSRAGRVAEIDKEVDLGSIAQRAVKMVEGRIRESGVKVIIHKDLPVVHGDEFRLSQVMQNLLENAIKFMGDQHEPRIEIGVRSDVKKKTCYIKDNGSGIDPNDSESIFGLFTKLNGSVEGSGIGLALVKRIVEVHNGEVWVESEGKGKGCVFCLQLPEMNEDNSKGVIDAGRPEHNIAC